MLNLLDRDFKSPILSVFKKLKENMSKWLKKNMKIMHHQIEIINKEAEITRLK